MRIIGEEETRRWLSERGLLDSTGEFSFSGFVKAIDSQIPADSGRKTIISREIVSLFETDKESLLWINEYGIFLAFEDRNLFEGFRTSLGEHSPLHEKPGHLFSGNDLKNVQSLVAMILYFVWGGILYSPPSRLAIKIDHHSYITIFVKDKASAASINEMLKKYL